MTAEYIGKLVGRYHGLFVSHGQRLPFRPVLLAIFLQQFQKDVSDVLQFGDDQARWISHTLA